MSQRPGVCGCHAMQASVPKAFGGGGGELCGWLDVDVICP